MQIRFDIELERAGDQAVNVCQNTEFLLECSACDVPVEIALISRNLEKIGDHATNIAEEVVYIEPGKDVRHHHETTECRTPC